MSNTSNGSPSRVGIWAALGAFLILWIAISVVAFTDEDGSAAIAISAAALVPLVLFGTVIILRDRRRRRR